MTASETTFTDLLTEAVTEPGSISEAYSSFHNYSFGNQLLALIQCRARGLKPGPLSTYKAWTARGRQVRRGSKALTLCVPNTRRSKSTDAKTGEEVTKTFVAGFSYRNRWFVISQTDGAEFTPEPLPDFSLGLAMDVLDIEEVEFDYADGNCQGYATERRIAINPVGTHQTRTRLHEVAHVVLGHTEGATTVEGATVDRSTRELEAEGVSYIIAKLFGLDGADDSRGYIQNWWQREEVPEEIAKNIFRAVEQILKAGSTK